MKLPSNKDNEVRSNFSGISSSHGFSLLEIVISIGILGVVLYGLSTMSTLMYKEINAVRVVQSRDRLNFYLSATLSNKRSIDSSLAMDTSGNAKLQNCLFGNSDPSILCDAEDDSGVKIKTPFTLYPPNATSPISGPLGTPLAFSADGQACFGELPSERCPISVETWFIADCGSGIKNCTKANDVSFYYEINKKFSPALKSYGNSSMPVSWSTLLLGPSTLTQDTLPDESDADAASPFGATTFACTATACCLYVFPTATCMQIPSGTSAISYQSAFGVWYAYTSANHGVGPTVPAEAHVSDQTQCTEYILESQSNLYSRGIITTKHCGSIPGSCSLGSTCAKATATPTYTASNKSCSATMQLYYCGVH